MQGWVIQTRGLDVSSRRSHAQGREGVPTICALLVILLLFGGVADARADAVKEAGDVIQILLPIVGFGSTFVAGSPDGGRWDKEGTWQATLSMGGALITMRAWKVVAEKLRPSGGARSSFPSGHTCAAFTGAAFIERRYGWKVGAPAYAGALFVAYSRVHADAHFADDVTAGASIAMLFAWRFVTPRPSGVDLAPMITDDGGIGASISMPLGGDDREQEWPTYNQHRYRYNFMFGPAYVSENQITSPSESGSTFDLAEFNKIDDPTTTASIDFDIALNDNQRVNLLWVPFESRDQTRLTEPIEFAGETFPADSVVNSAWRLYELRARWWYETVPWDRWHFAGGVGLMYQHLTISLVESNETVGAQVKDQAILPYLHGAVGFDITRDFSLQVAADGMSLSTDWLLDVGIWLNYRFSDQWDTTAGWQYYARDIETDEITNRVRYDMPHLAIAYSW